MTVSDKDRETAIKRLTGAVVFGPSRAEAETLVDILIADGWGPRPRLSPAFHDQLEALIEQAAKHWRQQHDPASHHGPGMPAFIAASLVAHGLRMEVTE